MPAGYALPPPPPSARGGRLCARKHGSPSLRPLDGLQAAHIALQHVRHRDRAALLLVGLHHRDERAPDGDAGAVERVDVAVLTAVLGTVARIHAPRLELAAERAGRDLAVHVL